MSRAKIVRVVCGLGVLVSLMTNAALAQPLDKRTLFTFNRPISLPGVTLPAGQYLFRLADDTSSRKVVQVSSADGRKHYALLISISARRAEASSESEVRFMETGSNTPSAVRSWWYIGETIGYEFIYPKRQARLLARGSVEPVLTTRTETSTPEETKVAELARLTPKGEEAAVAPPEPLALAGVGQPGAVASDAIVVAERRELPVTASDLPLVGLIGILTLAGAGSLRVWRTRLAGERA